MTFYVDTSLMVSAFVYEPASGDVTKWFKENDGAVFAISAWVATEFASAIAMKVRIGKLEEAEAGLVRQRFASDRTGFSEFDVITSHFEAAQSMIDSGATSLRAGDALHLAIAMANGATLCTRDLRFHEAAQALGAQSLLVAGA